MYLFDFQEFAQMMMCLLPYNIGLEWVRDHSMTKQSMKDYTLELLFKEKIENLASGLLHRAYRCYQIISLTVASVQHDIDP